MTHSHNVTLSDEEYNYLVDLLLQEVEALDKWDLEVPKVLKELCDLFGLVVP